MRTGRVDIIIQSTDKNFLVPVGGAIIASQDKHLLGIINSLYPGRASISPCLDLFITLLSMGESGYLNMLKQRKELLNTFSSQLAEIAQKHGERLLITKENTISFAITCKDRQIGPQLFVRRTSGARHVSANEKEVLGFRFKSYGSSYDGYPVEYLTAACAIGLTQEEMELFFRRLDNLLDQSLILK